MKFEALLELIKIIEYGDHGGVRHRMNEWWGFDKTQAIARELGKAVDALEKDLTRMPYAGLIVTLDHPLERDYTGNIKSKEPRGGWKK